MSTDTDKPQELKYASKVKSVWFNDKYALNSLPFSFLCEEIILSGTMEEATDECRKLITKSFKIKNITVDFNFVFFEMITVNIKDNKIRWTATKHNSFKYIPEGQEEKILPEVKRY